MRKTATKYTLMYKSGFFNEIQLFFTQSLLNVVTINEIRKRILNYYFY